MKNYTFPSPKKNHFLFFNEEKESLIEIENEIFLIDIYKHLTSILPYFKGSTVNMTCVYEIGEDMQVFVENMSKQDILVPYEQIQELDIIMQDAIIFNYSKTLKQVVLDVMFGKDLTFNISFL